MVGCGSGMVALPRSSGSGGEGELDRELIDGTGSASDVEGVCEGGAGQVF